jgi:hypothetical protein
MDMEIKPETMSENRKAYLDWLRNEVEHWCTDDGLFQVEYDHDDRITPDQILDAWEHYKDEGYASPMAYLENETLNIFSDMESYFYDCLLSDLRTAPNAVQDGWDEAQSIWDDLSDVGYHGIDMNLAPPPRPVILRVEPVLRYQDGSQPRYGRHRERLR